ncbi:KH domain-containing protein [Candidatus Rhabdochlamydia oedothoracis]|nr:KH domain-containing protein [Candidatus Rhabdochlamydia oedothoracis]
MIKIMKEFIAYIIKNIVDSPEEVNVQVIDNQKETTVEVRVSAHDVAKVVGRQGRTIRSLRIIAGAIGARFNCRVRVEVL